MVKISILYPNERGVRFIPNYTSVAPVIQINEVLIAG